MCAGTASDRQKRTPVTVRIDEEAIKKAQEALRNPEELERFEAGRRKKQALIEARINAVRDSERLTQSDFAIRINARPRACLT
jgi:DNA-binding transcriptional regulator YiaG